MCRAVLAETDGIVSEHVNRWDFRDCRQTHGWTHVIGKVKECSAEGAKLRDHHSIQRRSHTMLADAKMKIAPSVVSRLKLTRALEFQRRLIRSCKICRAPDQPGNILSQRVQNLARAVTCGHAFDVRRKAGKIFVPTVGKLAALHAVDVVGEIGELLAIFSE